MRSSPNWLKVSQGEQNEAVDGPHRRRPPDLEALADGPEVRPLVRLLQARDAMFAATDTATAPWYVANSDDKRRVRLNIISHILEMVPYEHEKEAHVTLPPRQKKGDYREPDAHRHEVPMRY